MTKEELFKEEYIDLFSPFCFEYLHELIGLLGYYIDDYDKSETRENVLETLQILFDFEILEVCDWIQEPKLNGQNLTNREILNHIDRMWLKNTKYSDFYNLLIFSTQNWYTDKLVNLGLTHTANWKFFVKEKIGNLEKWLDEKKPKK